MKNSLLPFVLMSILLTGCFAPVNLTYESANTLNKGEIDLQGNYSQYYVMGTNDAAFFNLNDNFGAKVGYGINNNYTIKFRYEHLAMRTDYDLDIFNLPVSEYLGKLSVNYFELENKFKFKNANIAIGAPIGYYSFMEDNKRSNGFFFIDPRVYFTFGGSSNKFEFNLIPKFHLFLNDGNTGFQPGISVGFGFSSDLNKWAIRPEFGFDGNASFGISLNLNLSNMIKSK